MHKAFSDASYSVKIKTIFILLIKAFVFDSIQFNEKATAVIFVTDSLRL